MISINWIIDYIFFFFFTVDIIINFFTEFKDVGESEPCRNIEKIALRYIRGHFLFDFVAWVPLHYGIVP